jgi:hypothetical protein
MFGEFLLSFVCSFIFLLACACHYEWSILFELIWDRFAFFCELACWRAFPFFCYFFEFRCSLGSLVSVLAIVVVPYHMIFLHIWKGATLRFFSSLVCVFLVYLCDCFFAWFARRGHWCFVCGCDVCLLLKCSTCVSILGKLSFCVGLRVCVYGLIIAFSLPSRSSLVIHTHIDSTTWNQNKCVMHSIALALRSAPSPNHPRSTMCFIQELL